MATFIKIEKPSKLSKKLTLKAFYFHFLIFHVYRVQKKLRLVNLILRCIMDIKQRIGSVANAYF